MGKTTEGQDFPKKPLLHFLAPAKMCLQMSFCFKVLAPAIWQSCSNMAHTTPLCSLHSACSPFSQRKPKLPIPRTACKDRETLVCRTHCHPYIGHCWRAVLCMYLSSLLFQAPLPLTTPTVQPEAPWGDRPFQPYKNSATDSARSHWPQEAWHLQRARHTAKGNRGLLTAFNVASKETVLKSISVWWTQNCIWQTFSIWMQFTMSLPVYVFIMKSTVFVRWITQIYFFASS